MHEGEALFKSVNPLMVLKLVLRLKYMKARPFAKRGSLLMVLKPLLRLKCMKRGSCQEGEPVDGVEAYVKANARPLLRRQAR